MTRLRGPRTLERQADRPLWSQLRDDLIRRLEGGEFDPRFPGELDLVVEYAVSRHTVREALRRLRADGLIESSRGRSSVAHRGVMSQQLGAMYSLFHELESRGFEQRSRLIALERRADAEAAERLGLSGDTPLVYLERVRLADDEPIAWDRAWLDPRLAEPLLEVDFTHTGLYDEWQRSAGITLTGGTESITAIVPGSDVKALLRSKRGEAALVIERIGLFENRPVEFRITVVRGTKFSFRADWATGRSYQVGIVGTDSSAD